MESSVSTSELLRTIRSDPDNASCADCGRESPQYASITHGSLICKSCYQAHTKLGEGISSTRDLKNSELSVIDLKFLILGGNSRLRNFFSIYQFPSRATIRFKYQTPASHYYREMLRCLVFNEAIEFEKPSVVEGRAISVAQKETGVRDREKMKRRGIISSIRRFFSRSYHGIVNYGNAVSMRLNDRAENSCFKKLEEELVPHMDKLANTGRDMFYGMANVMSKLYIKLHRKQPRSKRNDKENVDNISIELKDLSSYRKQSELLSQSPILDTSMSLDQTLNVSSSPSISSKSPIHSHHSPSKISINPVSAHIPKVNSLENTDFESSPSDPLPFAYFSYSKSLESSESRETEPEGEFEEMEEMPEILGSDEFEVLEEDEEGCI